MKILKFKYYQILRELGFKISKHVVLEYAKLLYVNKHISNGMCYSIARALKYYDIYELPRYVFDKFNYAFCKGKSVIKTSNFYDSYWWELENTKDRIKAFDKLIKYYKEHKEYI